MAKEKINYVNVKNSIEKVDADYYVFVGERSNGKTYSSLVYGLEEYINKGKQFCYVRRWEEDIKGDKGKDIFSSIVKNGVIEKLTKNKYNGIIYFQRKYFLARFNEIGEREEVSEEEFAHAFVISQEEHYKGLSYPKIDTIIFDEFISRNSYLVDEFVKFMNLLSTIIRNRNNVKIIMLGNTISKFCPYFNEMGITDIRKMNKGETQLYTYGESDLKLYAEFTDFNEKHKKSNKYFAFNNPKLNMIKNGSWELEIYPHLPFRYKTYEVKYIYYIVHEENILQAEIIKHFDEDTKTKQRITYIHRKTTPIKEDNKNLVYSLEISHKNNYRSRITKSISKLEDNIIWFFKNEKVFYQDNEIGEIVANYISQC